ncbi:unnamed protein product [Rotaria sordida]|uniref:Uncharacterized protein n=2 Tax=Rotaria sordida TaxID=392033 RepID=A0A814QGY1_9BILA|nr:unnamed protein product [Rotaria sordida]
MNNSKNLTLKQSSAIIPMSDFITLVDNLDSSSTTNSAATIKKKAQSNWTPAMKKIITTNALKKKQFEKQVEKPYISADKNVQNTTKFEEEQTTTITGTSPFCASTITIEHLIVSSKEIITTASKMNYFEPISPVPSTDSSISILSIHYPILALPKIKHKSNVNSNSTNKEIDAKEKIGILNEKRVREDTQLPNKKLRLLYDQNLLDDESYNKLVYQMINNHPSSSNQQGLERTRRLHLASYFLNWHITHAFESANKEFQQLFSK